MAEAVVAVEDSAANAVVVDELAWLHAHEYAPWGVHVSATQEHKQHQQHHHNSHASVVHYGISGAQAALVSDHTAVVVGGRDHPVDHFASTSRLDLFDLHDHKWLRSFDIQGELPRRVGHSVVSIGIGNHSNPTNNNSSSSSSSHRQRAVVFGGEALVVEPVDPVRECLSDCYEITFDRNVLNVRPLTFLNDAAASPADGTLASTSTASLVPSDRAWHSATAVTMPPSTQAEAETASLTPNAMLVLGGRDTTGKFLSDVWILSFAANPHVPKEGAGSGEEQDAQWTQLTPTGTSPLPLAYHSAVAVENASQVVVIGGRSSPRGAMLDTVFVLDLQSNAWSQLALATPSPSPSTAQMTNWLARCNATALEMCVPIHALTGKLAQIFKSSSSSSASPEKQEADSDEPSSDTSRPPEPLRCRQIFIFGGFSEHCPVPEPTRVALLDKQTGTIREIHAPNSGLVTAMGHAALASADATSLYVFGGIHAHSRQFVDTTSAIHFWKPQPGNAGDGGDGNGDGSGEANAIRTKVLENGDVYTGEMTETEVAGQLRRHGQGKCVYHNDGGVYDGEWRDDVRCGQGVMTFANGDTYAGQWENDVRHGYGIHESTAAPASSSSSVRGARLEKRYEGQWENDRRQGKGTLVFTDGSKLEGTWLQGQLQTSKCRLENYDDGNGVCTYLGEVRDGLPHGEGESTHVTRESYVGAWLAGKRSGYGVSTALDGTTYKGDWRNGKRNGFGVCAYARTRDEYTGKWVGGVRCGRGVCQYASGATYDGEWQHDKCHGVGKYTFPDGTFYEGNWKSNTFCGDGALVLDLDETTELE